MSTARRMARQASGPDGRRTTTVRAHAQGRVGGVVRAAVVIPSYNGARWLRGVLESVAAQTLAPAEVLVVDDGSTDGSAELAAGYEGVRVLALERNGGFARAANAGLAAVSAEAVALVNTDVVLAPDWLQPAGGAVGPGRAGSSGRSAPWRPARRRWRRRWSTSRTRRSSIAPATSSAATAPASSGGASSATAGATTRRARSSRPAPAPRSTGARRSPRSAGSTSGSAPTSRTSSWGCGFG